MREMGLKALYPRPRTSIPQPGHRIYPYLLKDCLVERPNQVWATDITYIKLSQGFSYLVAMIDLYSRYILSWRLSNTLDTYFCLDMLEDGLKKGLPGIINTDQGCQFTSHSWLQAVQAAGINVSMDGQGRWADNIFIERFWRTLKYECVFLNQYQELGGLRHGLKDFIDFYNHKRLHQALGYKTPSEVYLGQKCSPIKTLRDH